MTIATLPPRSKKQWLLGARVWATWTGEQRPPQLYEFIGMHNGLYFFQLYKSRNPDHALGLSLQQLILLGNEGTFRPFLLNSERMGNGTFIVEGE